MPSPFPGMDPYLETPDLWPDVHHELISQIRQALNPTLRPRYVARVELRVYDNEIEEARLESGISIAFAGHNHRGPQSREQDSWRPRAGEFRAGERGNAGLGGSLGGDRSPPRRRAVDYQAAIGFQRLPNPGVPRGGSSHGTLLAGERATTATSNRHPAPRPRSRHNPGPGRVWNATYDNGAYDLSIEYRRKAMPPLPREDVAWADRLLREHGRLKPPCSEEPLISQ